MRGIVIAGVSSGVGKTTVVTGLLGALRNRGLRVQPFKAGPDYIDPTYHTQAAGTLSRNLDTWLLPPEAVRELFHRAMSGKDVAVVEGVMGLYDGRSGLTEEGSTAQLAKLLGLPVVLVVDAAKAARSVAATVMGFQRFDPSVRFAGVVLNGIGSPGHLRLCQEAIEQTTGLPVLGHLPTLPELKLPERHLGLVPTVEGPASQEFFTRLAGQAARTLDLDRILAEAQPIAGPATPPRLFPPEPVPPQARLAIAMDKAFSFYYQDSLDLLQAWGAELVPFSPLQDAALPRDVAGVYIGGGFPEMFCAELSENAAMHRSLREAAARGMPIYAECGGLMYLGRAIVDFQGREHGMVGLVPAVSRMKGTRLTIGYRTVTARTDGPLLRSGEAVRGHEFHWSSLDAEPGDDGTYTIEEQPGRNEGFRCGSVWASYVHLHLGSAPWLAPRFVETCRRYQQTERRA
ncbi:MAG: cobyrinate a,c-diamide synthase [Dehalococcoidia bacterium]|nr:cobyrinate a,c-diamide synthase [Dehalococcoidia bacterium]